MVAVVLDTNVLVSGTITRGGNEAHVLRAWTDGHFLPVLSPSILEEVRRVLLSEKIRRQQFLSEEQIEELLALIEATALIVSGSRSIRVCRDPSDDKFLAAALKAKADFIVSGDPDLTDLKGYQEVRIVTPRQFLGILRATHA